MKIADIKKQHFMCKNTKCLICLNAATSLEQYFRQMLEKNLDWLGKYHLWLTKNNILAETEFGWPSDEAYKKENINRFIKENNNGNKR